MSLCARSGTGLDCGLRDELPRVPKTSDQGPVVFTANTPSDVPEKLRSGQSLADAVSQLRFPEVVRASKWWGAFDLENNRDVALAYAMRVGARRVEAPR